MTLAEELALPEHAAGLAALDAAIAAQAPLLAADAAAEAALKTAEAQLASAPEDAGALAQALAAKETYLEAHAAVLPATQAVVAACEALAEAINAKTVPQVLSMEGGVGSIQRAIGAEAGGAFLNALEAAAPLSAAIKWAMRLIDKGTLDFGDTQVRAQITAMATPQGGSMLAPEQAAALLALAERAQPLYTSLGFHRPLDWGDIKKARGAA